MNFEKLGVFYLGRPYDLENKKPQEGLILYNSKDLTTHAVCVGMTGSGKTGLCINLLEEAAIDHIPSIIIDPKGDMANLMLTFPNLHAEDFHPWINEDEAKKQQLSAEEYAAKQAEIWKKGLAEWGQDGDRIQMLRESADFSVYTPGSQAGIPVSILHSFDAPCKELLEDSEMLGELISSTVTSLLGLVGISADQIQSREHILLSTLLHHHWKEGKNLDIPSLIHLIQSPGFNKVGVMDLEVFYPASDRLALSMKLNNLLAAPGFSSWLEGENLDISKLLYTSEGKARVSIFSIAHLNDSERMFFVSLLLNHIIGWMRTQPGTSSLRALVYMDEIFDFFPPVANPPSKLPLLTLLKQARAYGVGMVLATQNPIDLDYKGLSNAGTWWLGRLQTERDKARVLDGLEGAATSLGSSFNRSKMEKTLAGLSKRIFLMHNVHEDDAVIFETRWAMSYLAGPLTRQQIKLLMDPIKAGRTYAQAEPVPTDQTINEPVSIPSSASTHRPVIKNELPQWVIPIRNQPLPGQSLLYQATMLVHGKVHFVNARHNIDDTRDIHHLVPLKNSPIPFGWSEAIQCPVALDDLEKSPIENANFSEIAPVFNQSSFVKQLEKEAVQWLYQSQQIKLWRSPSTKAISLPDESERDFHLRISQDLREQRDQALEALRKKYAPKRTSLEEKYRRYEQNVDKQKEQVKQQAMQTVISAGATILGGILGTRSISTTSIGRATTTARGIGRTMKQTQDVGRAKESFEVVKKQLEELEADFEKEVQALQTKLDGINETLESILVKPKKSDISLQLTALCWAPYWINAEGKLSAAF